MNELLKKKRRRTPAQCYTKREIKLSQDFIIRKKQYASDEAKKSDLNLTNKKITKFKLNDILKKNTETDKNGSNIKSIEELHNEAINKFNLMKSDDKLTYEEIFNEIISIYDLDESINELFLKKLNNYYCANKITIDNDISGKSDKIAKYFFTYIYTLNYQKRVEFYKMFNYYGENELFLKEDKKFIYKCSLEFLFKQFIKEILNISLTINDNTEIRKEENDYISTLQKLYEAYSFPNGLGYKIPIKFGNNELMYMDFIIKIQNIFCINDKGNNGKIFFKYNIKDKFLALNYFSNYFSLDKYEIINIQYILFCLYVFFRYYDQNYLEDIQYYINKEFLICSKYLYQDFEDKKKYLKELKDYITNDIELDKIDENYFKQNLLKITYDSKTVEINPLDYFFYGTSANHIKEIINQTNFSFEYCKTKNFRLFLNDNELNEDFNAYVKEIMNSNLSLEYIRSFKNLSYIKESIFTNDKIINEINSNTYYVRFPLKNIQGVTDRDTYSIFINSNLENKNEPKFLNSTTSKVITKSHENLNHVLRLLLNLNGMNIKKYTPREEKIFNKAYYNKITEEFKDQGDKWETIIFGEKINKIFIMGCIQILNISNFKLSIKDFKKKFKIKNKRFNINTINNELIVAKKNINNRLLKHVKPFEINDNDKAWLNEEQFIVARNGANEEQNTAQCIFYGFCGSDNPYY